MPSNTNHPRLATIAEAADYIRCTTRTVRRMVSRGDLVAVRIGPRMLRVDLNQIDALAREIPTTKVG